MESGKKYPQVIVLGIGNDLMMDDGVGIRTVEKVQALLDKKPASCVETVAANTDPRYVWTALDGKEHIILIDALTLKEPPGTVYKFSNDEFYSFIREHTSKGAFHAHDISIFDMIAHSENAGVNFGQITLIGVEPKTIELGMELTPEVENSVDKAASLVMDQLEEYGCFS